MDKTEVYSSVKSTSRLRVDSDYTGDTPPMKDYSREIYVNINDKTGVFEDYKTFRTKKRSVKIRKSESPSCNSYVSGSKEVSEIAQSDVFENGLVKLKDTFEKFKIKREKNQKKFLKKEDQLHSRESLESSQLEPVEPRYNEDTPNKSVDNFSKAKKLKKFTLPLIRRLMPQLKPDRVIGTHSKRFQNSVLKMSLSKHLVNSSLDRELNNHKKDLSRNESSLNENSPHNISVKVDQTSKSLSPTRHSPKKFAGNILQTKSINKYLQNRKHVITNDYSSSSYINQKYHASKLKNQDILFEEVYQQNYPSQQKSKPTRRYFDENKNLKMLSKGKDKGNYKSIECKQVDIPDTVKDENQRYYSPEKYVTIGVVDQQKPKISLSKSFDQFNPPKLSKSQRPTLTKVNSISVARMKYFLQKKEKQDNIKEENPESAFEPSNPSLIHRGFITKLPNLATKKRSEALVKYKSSKNLSRKIVPREKCLKPRKAEDIKISINLTKGMGCVTGVNCESYK
ncbi:unnamed protein product [Moneuplotes crassus]|uniref:Uncharacterized protein n=1 Tax=Euplotes crassus TaxID=5936 RepID=A0AAD1XAC8_EUPCR|nr:unnamed protein product [Moneuplotes crassus]